MSVTLSVRHARVERESLAGGPVSAWRVGNRVGESPVWDASTQTLLWIDVRAPELLRLDPAASVVSRWRLPEPVGAVGLATAGRVVLALTRSLALLQLSTGRLETLATIDNEPSGGNRLNDGRVSPSGRWFVFGSMDDGAAPKRPTGALYCASADGTVRRLHDGLSIANGIAWSPDGAVLYFSDSGAGLVWRAGWNESNGTLAQPPGLFCEAGEARGRPDGAAVDAAGDYWSAGVSAGCLNRFDADGRHRVSLRLPCRAPTMPCFGGERLGTLFVTSLVRPGWAADAGGLDGSLLCIEAAVRGLPASRWE